MADKQAAKKAALSKALSAAYLESQVADLEGRVKDVHINGDRGPPSAGPLRDCRDDAHQQRPATPTRVNDHQQQWRASPIPTVRARIDDDSPSPPSTPINSGEWNVYVVDVSALMWAPQCVRKLLNSSTSTTELIIPQDAIQTLDLLKKGNSSIAVAARFATRFIEHATRQWKPVSVDPSLAIQVGTNYKKGKGLRIQRENESVSLEDDLIQDTWLNNVIGCASYFHRIQRAEDLDSEWDEPKPLVLIAHPPLSAESGPSELENTERAEGYTLSLEAGRFELALEVLRDDETEDASRRGGRNRGTSGRGRSSVRGTGSGGGGGRRRKEPGPEPEREVKILLRRPDKAEDSAPSSPNANVDQSGEAMDAPFTQLRSTPQTQAKLPRPTQVSTKAHPPQPPAQQYAKQKHRSADDRSDTGRNRGRGKGRGGRGRGHYGGGFVLLQRPDTLVHHVGRGEYDRSGSNLADGGGGGGNGGGQSNSNLGPNANKNAVGNNANWRRAYATNDEPPPPPRNKVVVLQRPR